MTVPPNRRRPAEIAPIVKQARELVGLCNLLIGAPVKADEAVGPAYARARLAAVNRLLRATRVEALNPFMGTSRYTVRLQLDGINDVLQVEKRGLAGLTRVYGIGEAIASMLVQAAAAVRRRLDSELRYTISTELRLKEDERLLVALAASSRAAESISAELLRGARKARSTLREDLGKVDPAMKRWRMFTPVDELNHAYGAVDRLSRFTEESRINGFERNLKRAIDRSQATHSADAVWDDFRLRAATYFATLERHVPSAATTSAQLGNLAPVEKPAPRPKPVERKQMAAVAIPTRTISEIVRVVDAMELEESGLRGNLRAYQRFAAKYALVQRRVIFGDEMGLGKTIEAIAVMSHLGSKGESRFLVVCPLSLMINWEREIERWSSLRATRLHGSSFVRSWMSWQESGGVAIMSIDTMKQYGPGLFEKTPVSLFVLDEAHMVKNPQSQRHWATEAWTKAIDRVLFLTGSPLQNRVEELVTLVSLVRPSIAAEMSEVADGSAARFRQIIAPVYLRRNQSDVLKELPDIAHIDEWLELTAADLVHYRDAVRSRNFQAMRRAAFVAPSAKRSAKVSRLVELIEEAAETGEKVVVFSHYRDVLRAVSAAIAGPQFGPIEGAVSAEERQQRVDDFNHHQGHAVLLAQIQTGGEGLNLQAASIVILCEPQVKPSIEEQAIARVRRMGQTRAVRAYRLLTTNSVDERMIDLLGAKGYLFDLYARESAVADASRLTEPKMAELIIDAETERLSIDPIEVS